MNNSQIYLEKLTLNDVNDYLTISNNQEVKRFYSYAYACDINQAYEILTNITNENDYLSYKIINHENICVGIFICEKNRAQLGVSYIIKKEYRHQGYATKGLTKLILDIKKFNFYKEILFIADSENTYSNKLLSSFDCKIEAVVWEDKSHYLYSKIL